jgi:hypothetical protein
MTVVFHNSCPPYTLLFAHGSETLGDVRYGGGLLRVSVCVMRLLFVWFFLFFAITDLFRTVCWTGMMGNGNSFFRN